MRRFVEQPPWQRGYIATVIALGVGMTWFVFYGPVPLEPQRDLHPALLPILLVWMVLCSVVRLNLVIQGAMMTLGSAAVSLAQIQLGTREAMFVAALGAAVTVYASRLTGAREGRDQSIPLHRWLFNVCNCLLAAGAGGLAYDWVYTHGGLHPDQELVPATLAWALAYYCFNTAGVAIAVAIRRQQPVVAVWRQNFLSTAPGYFISAAISAAVVLTWHRLGAIWCLFVVPGIFYIFYSWKQALEKIAAARQYEGLIESARDGVVILKDGILLYANEAFARMVGYPRVELVSRAFAGLLAPGETPAPVLRGAGDQKFAEQQLQGADGRVVRVELSASPAVYQGRDGCVQALVRDVSERLAAVQSEKLRALGQMASGVAHDFNNSLMVILGNLTLARLALPNGDGSATDATGQRLEVAERAAQDAATTVRRLQAFGRPGTVSPETVNLHELAEEVLLMTRPIWRDTPRAASCEVTAAVAGESEVYARSSPAELREALTNMITNAVHAMPHGGALRLSTRRDGEWAVLSVSDTGTGMSAQVRERVFEPFYTTKGERGSGLGLFVTYGLVTQQGGDIEVVSAPGAGTTFHIRFPAAAPVPKHPTEETALPYSGARVLVVDDDPVVRDVVGSMLRSADLSVREAEDGAAALEVMTGEPFDLVITDLSMPDMSGLELAREIRARQPRLPILLLTGWAESPETAGLNMELVNSVLTKPIAMAPLLQEVTNALNAEAAEDPPAAAEQLVGSGA